MNILFEMAENECRNTKKKITYNTFYEPSISDISKYISNYEYEERLNLVKQEISTWHLYDQKIYELVFLENKSMLELSKQTGIDYYSIYRRVKRIKQILIAKL